VSRKLEADLEGFAKLAMISAMLKRLIQTSPATAM